MLIDEPIIRAALLDEYQKVFGDLSTEKEIVALSKRIEELKKEQ
jgi:hypothetical protein